MIFKSKPVYDWLIVGLGNPGITYEKTRHNVGFMAVDLLAEKENFKFSKNKYDALLGEYKHKNFRILVAKPQTYMNNSGQAVSKIVSFYKIPFDRIIIIFDDISLDVGKIRIRRKGSHGGHNGIKDIIQLLGKEDIMRIKVGVGAKPRPDYDLVKWVLGKFPEDQLKPLQSALEKSVLAVKETLNSGVDSAMNKFNS